MRHPDGPAYPVVKKVAPLPPSPSPLAPGPTPAPSGGKYEKPPCSSDETEAQVQGASSVVCAPGRDSGSCPAAPAGTKAMPQCVLQDSASGQKYCALVCIVDTSCPEGATCSLVGGFAGFCTYPKDAGVGVKALALAPPTPIFAV